MEVYPRERPPFEGVDDGKDRRLAELEAVDADAKAVSEGRLEVLGLAPLPPPPTSRAHAQGTRSTRSTPFVQLHACFPPALHAPSAVRISLYQPSPSTTQHEPERIHVSAAAAAANFRRGR
jgi:hypothetical protein